MDGTVVSIGDDVHTVDDPYRWLPTLGEIDLQTLRGKVMRVLPRVNEAVNECWLSDRDRFSYEALSSEERLRVPMIRRGGRWEEVDWPTALEYTVEGLRRVLEAHGADALGALASPIATLEARVEAIRDLFLGQEFSATDPDAVAARVARPAGAQAAVVAAGKA